MHLTPIEIQLSSGPEGNFTINLEPAFSSESLRGRNRHTTLMLSSAAISRSAAIFIYKISYTKHFLNVKIKTVMELITVHEELCR